jgi:hypothetical protein
MRNLLSVPQQIRGAILSGDLTNALRHARLAHLRNEREFISGDIVMLAVATTLRQEYVEGRLTKEDVGMLADALIHRRVPPLVASLIVIRVVSQQPGELNGMPEWAVLEVLDILAAEQDSLSDLELLNAARSLANG